MAHKRSNANRAGEREPLAALTPSPVRRHLASGLMLTLGAVLVYVAFNGWNSFSPAHLALAALGLSSFVVAWRMHAATSKSLHLCKEGVYSSDGTVVAEIGNIARVERGLFAFKPSNGFLIVLKNPMGHAWQPGLWWRLGRRIGVGGVTPQGEGKVMAERLHLLLHNQD